MKCREVRNWLAPLADGEVRDRARRRALEAHLRECPACRREYATQVEIKRMVHETERVQPSPHLATRVRAEIRVRPRTVFGPVQFAYIAAMLLAAVVITGGLLVALQQAGKSPAVSGLFKELPATSSISSPRRANWRSLKPAATGESVTPGSFVEFVQAEHNQALELVRAHSEWADDLESLLVLIGQDVAVDEETHLKELPQEDTAEEGKNEAR